MKTAKLTGTALDWAVAKCDGATEDWRSNAPFLWNGVPCIRMDGHDVNYRPSTDWSQGGPIIEREDINVNRFTHSEITEFGKDIYRKEGWTAFTTSSAFWITPVRMYGHTPLIAAMRCYVASKLGDEIEIPEDLK